MFQRLVRDRIAWIAASLSIPGVILFLVGVRLAAIEWRFHFRSDVTQGTVLSKWKSSSYRSGVFYSVRYEYSTLEGGPFEDTDSVGSGLWRILRERGPVEVIYLPQHPGHSRLAKDWRVMMPLVLLLVGGCCGGMGGMILFLEGQELQAKRAKR